MKNTIKHTFRRRRNNTVLIIHSFIREEKLIIQIADNGVGTNKGKLIILMKHIHNNSAEPIDRAPGSLANLISPNSEDISICLTNIYRRLKLSFGKEADLMILSK